MKLCPYCHNPLSDADVARLQAENARLREERDHWHVEQVHAYGNWEDAHKRAIELEAENDKLKHELELEKFRGAGEIEAYRRQTSVAVKKAAQVKAENDDLRELVRDMWRFTGAACKKYPRLFDPAAQGGQMVQLNMLDNFEQRMAELGMEVES